MSEEVVVTRGSQITLTKEIREKAHIKEGDIVILNIVGDTVLISKKDPKIFDNLKAFLPANFTKVLSKLHYDHTARLKKLGIIE